MGIGVEDRTTPPGGIEVPPSWGPLEPERLSGTILVVGASDSGKSTLVRWLFGELRRHRRRVGWLDADIGQSTLGLPGTMNLALPDRPPAALPSPRASFFVGATSPRGHMLPTLVGMERLKERARAEGATAVVVDTTGLVAPEAGGGALKEWQVELLGPETVIALQRGRELEHLLGPWRRERRFALHILPVAEGARSRSPEERSRQRRELFHRYFRGARPLSFDGESLPVYGLEKDRPWQLLALQGPEGFALALGVRIPGGEGTLKILSPLPDPAGVAALRFGSLRVDPATGEQLP